MRIALILLSKHPDGDAVGVWGCEFYDVDFCTKRLLVWNPGTQKLELCSLPLLDGRSKKEYSGWHVLRREGEWMVATPKVFWGELMDSVVFADISDRDGTSLFRSRLRTFIDSIAESKEAKLMDRSTFRRISLVAVLTVLKRAGVRLSPRGDAIALSEHRSNNSGDKAGHDALPKIFHSPDEGLWDDDPFHTLIEASASTFSDSMGLIYAVVQTPYLPSEAIDHCIAGMGVGYIGAAFDGLDLNKARVEMSASVSGIVATLHGFSHAEYWGLKRNGQWIGFVGLIVWPNCENKLWVGYLNILKLSSASDGGDAGYGKLLLGVAIRRAKNRGFPSLSVWTSSDNVRAASLYYRAGFVRWNGVPPEKESETATDVGDDGPSICFVKDLRPCADSWPCPLE